MLQDSSLCAHKNKHRYTERLCKQEKWPCHCNQILLGSSSPRADRWFSALVEVTSPVEFFSCTQIFHHEQRSLSDLGNKQMLILWIQCITPGVLQSLPACTFSSLLHTGHAHFLLPRELIPGQGLSNHHFLFTRNELIVNDVWIPGTCRGCYHSVPIVLQEVTAPLPWCQHQQVSALSLC